MLKPPVVFLLVRSKAVILLFDVCMALLCQVTEPGLRSYGLIITDFSSPEPKAHR